MKSIFITVAVLTLITIFTFSCSKEQSSSKDEIGGDTTSQSNTWIKLSAVTLAGVPKANYIVMMFKTQPTDTKPLPTIEKQVVTDANGIAYFDLNKIVTSTTATTYYFEAFVENGTGYTWKSIIHPSLSIAKGQMITSSIIVKD